MSRTAWGATHARLSKGNKLLAASPCLRAFLCKSTRRLGQRKQSTKRTTRGKYRHRQRRSNSNSRGRNADRSRFRILRRSQLAPLAIRTARNLDGSQLRPLRRSQLAPLATRTAAIRTARYIAFCAARRLEEQQKLEAFKPNNPKPDILVQRPILRAENEMLVGASRYATSLVDILWRAFKRLE